MEVIPGTASSRFRFSNSRNRIPSFDLAKAFRSFFSWSGRDGESKIVGKEVRIREDRSTNFEGQRFFVFSRIFCRQIVIC